MASAELIVALDFPGAAPALALVDRLGDAVRHYKVGLELFTREGPEIVRALGARGRRVFLDLKLHDIPNTVAGAASAAAALEVDLLTVHAAGGGRMVAAARGAVEGSGTRILAVTVLTSLSSGELAAAWGRGEVDPAEEVLRLAVEAVKDGAHGVVAAPGEAAGLRERVGDGPILLTPGIRLPGEAKGDQSRTATPAEAVRGGADFLVVGRPITGAPDPLQAVERIRSSMAEGARAI